MGRKKDKITGYLTYQAEIPGRSQRKWTVAEISENTADDGTACWYVLVEIIDAEYEMSSTEFFDTLDEALNYARHEVKADLVVLSNQGWFYGNTAFKPVDGDLRKDLYFDCARKMDVRAKADGSVTIYSDLAYNYAEGRRVVLTKEQAMWLMQLLPEAVASIPDYGWDKDVRKDIKRRNRMRKEKEKE